MRNDFMHHLTRMGIDDLDLSEVTELDDAGLNCAGWRSSNTGSGSFMLQPASARKSGICLRSVWLRSVFMCFIDWGAKMIAFERMGVRARSVAGIVVLIGLVVMAGYTLMQIRTDAMNAHSERIKHLVEVSTASSPTTRSWRPRRRLTREEAQAQAREASRTPRFNTSDHYFLYDFDGRAVMVAGSPKIEVKASCSAKPTKRASNCGKRSLPPARPAAAISTTGSRAPVRRKRVRSAVMWSVSRIGSGSSEQASMWTTWMRR